MATPWWLGQTQTFENPDGNGGGYVVTKDIDRRTGQQVFQQDGKWYSSLPTQERWIQDEYGSVISTTPASAGALVDETPLKSATFLAGQQAPYGNLGMEVGMVDGKPTYLYPAGDASVTQNKLAGDIGMYGGAQRAYWRSPSGARGQLVTGPDGAMWIAPPSDATFGENDTADHSTMISQAWSSFGPIITAALSGGLGNGLTSGLADTLGGGLTGQIGSKALMGGATSLLSGGDAITGALSGGLGGVLGGALPSLDLGLPSYATSALTGGVGAAISGGNPLTGALLGAGSNLASGALGDLGLPAPATSALLGGAKSLIGGGDPLMGAIMGGGSGLLGQVARAPDYQYTLGGGDQPSSVDVQNIPQDTSADWTSGYDLPSMDSTATGRDLVNSFSSNPSPSTTVDTLAANTTGPNPAQAWGDSVDNMDSFLGQFAASPSPVNSDLAISGTSQQTAGQPLSEPFQQPASSLPWDQPAGSLNTYTEQQPVTNPAEPVTQSPVSGGGDMSFFDNILGSYTGDMGEFSPGAFQTLGNNSTDAASLWPTTGAMNDYSNMFNPSGTYADNYLKTGIATDPTQTDPNSTYFPITPDQSATATSGWDKFLSSMPPGLSAALGGLTNAVKSNTGQSIISRGLAAAPALAAISYAKNQTPFDTSKLQSIYDQYNPSAQAGMYDMATGQQRNALLSDQERRQISGSSFGDQSLASFGTIRDLGRSALLNQGLRGQADIASKMLDAQAKQRASQNQLYGSALYALGGALSPRNPMMGFA